MAPKNVRVGELADLLSSLEQALSAIVGVPPEELILGLVDVRDQSAGYAVSLPSDAAADAVRAWGNAIRQADFTGIPRTALEPTRKILSFVRRHNCIGTVVEARKRTPLAQMTPDTVITAHAEDWLTGKTTLYGYALRVGGANPRVFLRMDGAANVTVDLASETLAREIGERLYSWVGLSGTARWHPHSRALMSFMAEELLPYDPDPARSLIETLGDLSTVIGDDLADLDEDDLIAIRNFGSE
jgi:hypothetical protein